MGGLLRNHTWFGIGCALIVAAGCGTGADAPDDTSAIGTRSSAVELYDLGNTYGFAFVPAAPLGPAESLARLKDRLQRQSFPTQATGAVIVPLRDSSGNPVSQFGSAVRFTCGATLISPSYFITAAHCVDSESVRTSADLVKLQMYRPTRRLGLEEVWRPKTQLAGTYPDYQHESFTEEDGYFVDNYTCEVIARCAYGAFNCPGGNSDTALVHCAERPGDRYGYLNVAASETRDTEVFIPWKHEVYDVAANEPTTSDKFLHYVRYPTVDYWENYHYLDRNQLLPLMTIGWPDGTPRRKVGDVTGSVVWTDALACHGTSGSGFLQQNTSSGAWEFLGPCAVGGAAFGGMLCQHFKGVPGQQTPAPGQQQLGYASVGTTQFLLNLIPDWKADCVAQPSGFFTLGGRSACQRQQSGLTFAERTAYTDLDPWSSQTTRITGATTSLGSVTLENGKAYRLSVGLVPDSGCTQQGSTRVCPEIVIKIGTREVLRKKLEASAGQSLSVGALFTADQSASLPITLGIQGSTFEVGDFTIVPNQNTNAFDTGYERAEGALVVPDLDKAAALPLRFTGDGIHGFTALLHSGERLVLARQAVALRGTFHLNFSASQAGALNCGLLARDGSVLTNAPCSPAQVNVLNYAGATTPTAVFIDGAPANGVEIDNINVVLDSLAPSSHCEDGARNEDESDVDCGGSCSACGDGKTCNAGTDCQSTSCVNGLCACKPTTCLEREKNCGSIADNCGGTLNCGSCTSPQTCGGSGVENVCGCSPETNTAFCSRLGKNCGSVTALDNCGVSRTVTSCGACTSPNTCGGGGTPNVCGKPACTPESNTTFCTRVGKNCGSVTALDNCGVSRTVTSCGTCTSPNTCGGGGTANVCGKPACTPESNTAFCSRLGKNCGSVTGADNCGTSRTVTSCGTCSSPDTCGGGGTANVCGSGAPACFTRYAQSNCLTYIQGVKVSANGRNWHCTNGNCANCAGFASCAPGGTGCPWGVVWTDMGVCR